MPDRDRSIIESIHRYCEQIDTAHSDFGRSEDTFQKSSTYQNAVSMCILQIGEIINRLSDGFRNAHSEIPWRQIRGMRNYVAHEYGTIDLEIVWQASTVSIESLKTFCMDYLKAQSL